MGLERDTLEWRVLEEHTSILLKDRTSSKNIIGTPGGYTDIVTLDLLAKRRSGRKIGRITPSDGELAESMCKVFGRKCGKFAKTICGICHDHFIIVVQKESSGRALC